MDHQDEDKFPTPNHSNRTMAICLRWVIICENTIVASGRQTNATENITPLVQVNMLRPYPGTNIPNSQRAFNYFLPRARRVVENALVFLTVQWRIYHQVIGVSPHTVIKDVTASVALHNFQQ